MYREKEMIYIKALTPIHAGAGQTLESVDMPIQREKHSGIPKIEASSLKGSIKHALYQKMKNSQEDINTLYTIFGAEDSDKDYASAIGFTDAKLLFFPVKSATDIFKLITCPYILKRWMEDVKLQNDKNDEKSQKNDIETISTYFKKLVIDEGRCITNSNNPIILEEYIFERDSRIDTALQNFLEKITNFNIDTNRIVILNDSDFIDLVTMYTEIITRNKINVETGTAQEFGLFTEEYLPTESILYFTVLASPSFDTRGPKTAKEVVDYFDGKVDEVFQVGGNATIGKGFVKRSGEVGGVENEQSEEH